MSDAQKQAALDFVSHVETAWSQATPPRRFERDRVGEPVIWANDRVDLLKLLAGLGDDPKLKADLLSDETAYDNTDGKEGAFRFVLVVQLYSLTFHARIRVKLGVNENEEIPSLTSLWQAANWLEREIFDMYGIRFSGHPNLRRILMDDRFKGYPLRKEYDIRDRQPLHDSLPLHITGEAPGELQTSTGNDPDEWQLSGNGAAGEKRLSDFYNPNVLLNMGPSHPAMHGTLRVMCRVNGETIENATCELGYLHRAIEKLGETKTYHQWIVYTDRLNYCSALNNNIAYCMAVENVLNITPTERCQWIRVICMELSRIIDHIICIAINALDMGALTIFWILYEWREEAYTIIEAMCGMRLTTSYARIGGMSYDLPDDFDAMMKRFLKGLPKAIDECEGLLTKNRIWIDRTHGVTPLSKEDALSFGVTGPCLRASGVDFDLRRDRPYYTYPELDFDVAIGTNGDVYDRYLVRLEEMRQSIRILKQCLQKLPGGPIWVEDRRVRIPDKKDVYTKMEVLIHHFKIFMEGIDVPPGEAYSCVEGPNGELGYYIVSRGGPKAWRLRIKSPSFFLFQSFEHMVKGGKIPDAIAALGSVNIIAGELDR